MDLNDEGVWSAVCAGDEDAFAEIFHRHCDAVFVQLARRSGSYDAADDLLSTVFLQAWRSRERVHFHDGSIRPWLLVTASNIAATQLRSRRRYASMTKRLAAEPSLDATMVDVEARADAEMLGPALAAAISRLSSHEQQVVALCDLAELRYGEAAQVLNLPIGTVKSRLARAHTKLRKQLGQTSSAVVGLEAINAHDHEV